MIPNAQIDTNPIVNQKSELVSAMRHLPKWRAEIYRYLRGWVKNIPKMRLEQFYRRQQLVECIPTYLLARFPSAESISLLRLWTRWSSGHSYQLKVEIELV